MIKLEFCYNPNIGAASRGTESDVDNVTAVFAVRDEEDAVRKVYDEVFGYDDKDVEEETEGDYSPEYLIQFGDSRDITGGDAILFWVCIDGKLYESSVWDERDFSFDDDPIEDWNDHWDQYYNSDGELEESIKKTLKEDGRSFGQRFRMSKKDFEDWQKATSKNGLAYVRDLDGVKACYIDSFDKTYKRNMPKHIGTWNPETEELFCDDVSLFGHEVTESASNRLSKIFKTGKIEENSRVVINFDDPDDAKEFKEEMKKRFNYPKTTSRYRVVHGTSESGKCVFVESKRGNKKMKNRRVVEANSGFKPLRELLDSLVDPEDYADFLEYAADYGYDFEYEDPNAVWPVDEIQELVDCYYNDEDFGGYFGDPELHMEYDDETGDINLDMAYSDWIKSYAPNYDVSNEDAWRAGVELAGGVYDEASGQKYSEWVESFAPNYDISNEDAFTAGFKSIVEDPEITCFESATPYKERGVSYERRGR